MTEPTPRIGDLPRIAAALRLAGELLERDGVDAWERTAAWQYGPAAVAYGGQGGGGNRWDGEGDEMAPVPLDRTGDAAVDAAMGSSDGAADLHAQLVAVVAAVGPLAARLVELLTVRDPGETTKAKGDRQLAEIGAAGWCISCYRDAHYLEPVHRDRFGKRIYAVLCRWCGDFRRQHDGIDPPVELLRLRHSGTKRISAHVVAAALARVGA